MPFRTQPQASSMLSSGRSSPLHSSPPHTLRDGDAHGGRWVAGPEVIHCHDEIAYHFMRDSLVFIPGERALPWVPVNFAFAPSPKVTAPSSDADLHA